MKPTEWIGIICDECAHDLGLVPRDKQVGVWMDRCEMCEKYKPCTDLWHDWKKEWLQNETD